MSSVFDPHPIPTCLKASLPIEFHGLYSEYAKATPHLDPAIAPPIDIAIADDVAGKAMAEALADYIANGFTGCTSEKLRNNVYCAIRKGGGFVEGWKLWRVAVMREALRLSFVEHDSDNIETLAIHLSSIGSLRMVFRICPPMTHQIYHKLYLDYQRTSWVTAVQKVTEWRCNAKDIPMMTWYFDTDSLRLSEIFQNDEFPLKYLLRPDSSSSLGGQTPQNAPP